MAKGKVETKDKTAPVPGSSVEETAPQTIEDTTPERFFVLKAALLGCHKSGYKEIMDLAEMIAPTEHQWQRFRHKILDVMNEQEKALRVITAQMLEEVKAK